MMIHISEGKHLFLEVSLALLNYKLFKKRTTLQDRAILG